jgi:Uma2 family endonuclease
MHGMKTRQRGRSRAANRPLSPPSNAARVKPRNGQAHMTTTLFVDGDSVCIPAWVHDLNSFRRWARSDEFPETGRICYLNGEVWVDMTKEQIFSHNQVKAEFARVLLNLVKLGGLGWYLPEGVLLSSVEAKLTCQPDGTFVSAEALRNKRVRLVEGKREEFVELEGAPDMVLEVVSESSVGKDYKELRELYWHAGIQEYWLADARGEKLLFEILRHTSKGYAAARKQGGWQKSAVFGKSLRFTRRVDELGIPAYKLAMR